MVAGSNLPGSIEAAVSVLYDEVRPKTSEFTTVSVDPDRWINRSATPGAQVEPRLIVSRIGSGGPEGTSTTLDSRVTRPMSEPEDRSPSGGQDKLLSMWAVLGCYLLGLVGASTSLILEPVTDRGPQATARESRHFLVARVATRAIFGLVLYALLVLVVKLGYTLSSSPSVAAEVPLGHPIFFLASGFVGGLLGQRVLQMMPLLRGSS